MTRPDSEEHTRLHQKDGSLDDFIALAANVTEAFTAALFLVDTGGDLRLRYYRTLSDHLRSDACIAPGAGLLSDLAQAAEPVLEPHFEGDSSATGIYSGPEEIRAYMAAPVGDGGILWVDTRKAYGFTPKHLKILGELANTATNLLGLSHASPRLESAEWAAGLCHAILPPASELSALENNGLDFLVSRILESGFEGVLAAVESDSEDVLRIAASQGFADWVRKDRLVRKEGGLANQALETSNMVLVPDTERMTPSPSIFHQGEELGLEMKSVMVVPFLDGPVSGVLAAASSKPDSRLEHGGPFLAGLPRLLGLLQTSVFNMRLLDRVRRHDGESGLFSEGYFRQVSRETFEKVRERKGKLTLLLVQIMDMDEIYLRHSHTTTNRFLETFTDRITRMVKGQGIMGKFLSGGFGVLIEDLPAKEVELLKRKTLDLFSTKSIDAAGEEVVFDVRIAAAHYPGDCSDLDELWRIATAGLSSKPALDSEPMLID